jgi:hypothetical protein
VFVSVGMVTGLVLLICASHLWRWLLLWYDGPLENQYHGFLLICLLQQALLGQSLPDSGEGRARTAPHLGASVFQSFGAYFSKCFLVKLLSTRNTTQNT